MPAHDVTLVGTYTDGTGIDSMTTDNGQRTTVVLDLAGRRMPAGPLPRGIYIINGKKTFVK